MSAYHFVDSDQCRPPGSMPIEYELTIRQQPDRAKVCTNKEKERRPIDPPPIVQLKIKDPRQDPCQNYLQSPHLFLCVDLCSANDGSPPTSVNNALAGTSVSSLYRLKDIDNSDGGFFVFGDLSVKMEGPFRLRFYLFEVRKGDVVFQQSITSDKFQVYNAKQFPGMLDSTFLSRSFSDQGVRIRIRKEHRIKMKRPPPRAIVSPDHLQQYPVDQRPSVHQYPPAGGSPQGYDNRGSADYHYAGVPARVHVSRQVEYHPYQRPQYPYADRPQYPEIASSHYYPSSPYRPVAVGPHLHQEYTPSSTYGKQHPAHSQPADYYPTTDGRSEPPSSPHYHSYPESRARPYPESQARQHSAEQRPYDPPYSSETSRNPHYVNESRQLQNTDSGHPPQWQAGRRSPPKPPQQNPQHYREPASTLYDSFGPESTAQAQHPVPPHQHPSHDRRESRHSINAILSEGGRASPHPGSKPDSDASSTSAGRVTPLGDRSGRGVVDDPSSDIRLPPLRNKSNVEEEHHSEQSQGKPNSSVWKLVSVAMEPKS